MSSRKFDYVAVIGRFQILHRGHEYLFQEAFDLADRVIILCGSAFQARSFDNPFSVDERERMIALSFPEQTNRYEVIGIPDFSNNQQWAMEVQKAIDSVIFNGFPDSPTICLVGHKKDDKTSEYLDMFPQYDYKEVQKTGPIDATTVRDLYFEPNAPLFNQATKYVISKPIQRFLEIWKKTVFYSNIQEERQFTEDFKKSWAFTPHPPKFITADSVVIESAHILLIQRGEHPGRGQWALPGGHLDEDSSLKECAIRELHEETGLKVPVKVLRGSIVKNRVFDKLDRDPRGRYVTHVFLFNLSPCPDPKHSLTPIKPASDAKEAVWVPLADVEKMRDQMFLDHYDIIFTMLGNI